MAPVRRNGASRLRCSRAELDVLRQAFGLIVIPDGTGGFIHNGDVYLIDADGRLARAFDPDAAPRIFVNALSGSRP